MRLENPRRIEMKKQKKEFKLLTIDVEQYLQKVA